MQAVFLGVTVGLMAAVVPACGGTRVSRCLTSNCDGCCDENLGCLPGDEVLACGSGAVTCQKCSAGQSCVDGVCRLGGLSADGGGTCSPATCSGCCDATGACVAGNLPTACGGGGLSCNTCQAGESCQAGACSAALCNGCVDALGNCLSGNTALACGKEGSVCVACSFDQACENGACVGGGCNATNCADGCCSGDTCVRDQPNDTQCGSGGAQCVGCESPSVCQADGTCSDAGVTDGGTNIEFPLDGGFPKLCGPGGADPCLTGCCLPLAPGLDVCVQPGNPLATGQCGINGSVCKRCSAGQSCIVGMCI